MKNRVVLEQSPHMILRGDLMPDKKKYDATYQYGNTTVHVVAPKPMPGEQKQKIIREMHLAGWTIIQNMSKAGVQK
jgi:hypothetical protein